ncbi:DUF4202 domain-containing protein [Flagellimonas flava]|uniref:DUF4202 domain-containing protein n=1 Tax=Flagellimonas flava TaxID=570519 RepID=A0A1M5M336_9FLAO|nr:DUF4202 domain-containing protein [Allomuricauda flava]SHG71133.1 protein of unknown function [Allomuricauda flava]
MGISPKLQQAFDLFDEANARDPNIEEVNGKAYPKELLYAQRMTETLDDFEPNASMALKLAARSQHICRWEVPRNTYEMDRVGYLKWRQELKKFHAEKAAGILQEVGFTNETIDQVQLLLQKKQLKKNKETQTLEDVICLVFLKHYFEPFAEKHEEKKVIDILGKTWKKMSTKGQSAALKLTISRKAKNVIQKAIDHGAE